MRKNSELIGSSAIFALVTFVVIAGVVAGVALLFQPSVSEAADCGSPRANITAQILADGRSDGVASARITNNSSCTYQVGFASYRINANGQLERQTLHDARTFNLGPHQVISPGQTGIAVPSDCQYQLDVFEGEPLVPPLYNGNNLLAYREILDGRPWCGQQAPSTSPLPEQSPTPVPTPSPTPVPTLTCSPSVQGVVSGAPVSFTATGGATSVYLWTAESGDPSLGFGSSFSTRFFSSTNVTKTVFVENGGKTASCQVVVGGTVTPTPTPSPTPTPTPGLSCSPGNATISSGQAITFSASGGPNSIYLWNAPGGDPSLGFGSSFSTRFFTFSFDETRTVSVESGNQSASCQVRVLGTSYPTPTPGFQQLNIDKTVRNVSSYNSEGNSTTAMPGETVEFTIRVWNDYNTTAYNTRVTDFLPSGLRYVNGSTTVDGNFPGDGITFNGISLGTFNGYRSATIRFRAVVESDSWFSTGTSTITNTARVFADNVSPQEDTARVTVARSQGATSGELSITKYGRNVTRGPSSEQSSLSVYSDDTVEFIIRVRSLTNTTLYNVIVTDPMPSGLTYSYSTTSVNGVLTNDSIISGGLNIGTLYANQEVVIRLNARIQGGSLFPYGGTITNIASVRADNTPTVSAHLPIIAGTVLAPVTRVPTGASDTTALALLVSVLATYGYARMTSTRWHRIHAIRAMIRRDRTNADTLNFARFLG